MNLTDKLESAFVSVLQSAIPGVQIVTGKNATVKGVPIIICWADGQGEEDPPFSGNYWLNGAVEIKGHAGPVKNSAAAKVAQQDLHGLVYDALRVTDIAEQLTAGVADFTVFPNAVLFDAPVSGNDDAGVWTDAFPFRVYCCPTDFAS